MIFRNLLLLSHILQLQLYMSFVPKSKPNGLSVMCLLRPSAPILVSANCFRHYFRLHYPFRRPPSWHSHHRHLANNLSSLTFSHDLHGLGINSNPPSSWSALSGSNSARSPPHNAGGVLYTCPHLELLLHSILARVSPPLASS